MGGAQRRYVSAKTRRACFQGRLLPLPQDTRSSIGVRSSQQPEQHGADRHPRSEAYRQKTDDRREFHAERQGPTAAHGPPRVSPVRDDMGQLPELPRLEMGWARIVHRSAEASSSDWPRGCSARNHGDEICQTRQISKARAHRRSRRQDLPSSTRASGALWCKGWSTSVISFTSSRATAMDGTRESRT